MSKDNILLEFVGIVDATKRHAAAWNPDTTPDDLATLATDRDPHVRCGVASNRRTPPATLSVLSSDADDYVRRDAACNPQTPYPALAVLSIDKVKMVRQEVPFNPNCPPLVKLYLQSGQYGGMTLKEFLEAAREIT